MVKNTAGVRRPARDGSFGNLNFESMRQLDRIPTEDYDWSLPAGEWFPRYRIQGRPDVGGAHAAARRFSGGSAVSAR